MVIEENKTDKMTANMNIGKTVRTTLLQAKQSQRLICGLSSSIKMLSHSPEDALFCFLAPPSDGDSATHMHEVLLQAYCFENDIYIIKVDSSEKLSRILGSLKSESCAMVQRTWITEQTESLSDFENTLVDYCEEFWDAPRQPIIRLPEP